MKKLLNICIAFILAFTLGQVGVKAESAPSTISVKRAIVLNDIVTNYDHGFTIFNTSDGKTIYCLDVDKTALKTGQTATYSTDGDAGLLYILQNGYPNKQITGNNNIDMYITQAAVWWYMDETGQGGTVSSEFKNATKKTDIYEVVPNYIKPLVTNAKSAKDTQTKPSITLTNNGTQLTLTSDGKYYESKYMAAALVGAKTYNVSVSGGTKNTTVIDESGNIGSTMNSSERFKIRIPKDEITTATQITVKTSATGTIQKARIYKPSDSSYQRVVGLYNNDITVDKQITLSVSPKTDKHVCEYTDDKYYGSDGTVVDKKTYDKQCGHTCEYNDGKYYGSDGTVVDKDTYDTQCGQEVTVPNTSANIIFASVAIGVLAIVIGTGIIMYTGHKNNKKLVK